MKKILLIIIALWVVNTFAQLPFNEDFSNGIPLNWENLYAGWNIDNQNSGGFPTESNGFVRTTLGTFGNQSLTTNAIDMSGITNPILLSFYYSLQSSAGHLARVQLSDDNGVNWSTIDTLIELVGQNYQKDISNFVNGSSNVKIRFLLTYSSGIATAQWGIDDIGIYEITQNDLGITQILSPNSSCSLNNETVTVIIKNYGVNNIPSGTQIEYSIDGSNWIAENTNTIINSGDEFEFTFSQTVDLSAPNTYNLQVRTVLSNDEVSANNEKAKTILNQENIVITPTSPYLEDFETNNGNFVSNEIQANNSWEWGAPNSTNLQEGANASVNAWATNLTGTYENNEISYTETPCFDLSALSIPVFEFDVWYRAENAYSNIKTIMRLEYSTDYGVNWIQVGVASSSWYEDIDGFYGLSNGWQHKKIEISDLAHQTNVKFRMYFREAHYTQQPTEGFAFDNISIHEKPAIDVMITNWTSPTSACYLTNQEMVRITIFNNGTETVTDDIPLKYSIDSGNTWTDGLFINTSGIQVGESAEFIFYQSTELADFSAAGLYNCIAKTDLANDGDTTNNSFETQIRSKAYYDTEYTEDFESTNAINEWFSYSDIGSPNDWELSTPSTTVLNSAASGTNAWVTNATGNYQTEQTSYVESPCFNLSNIDYPAIKFNINAILYGSTFYVEYSINNGDNWVVIPANPSNMPSGNWYQMPSTMFHDANINSTNGYVTKFRSLVDIPEIMSTTNSISLRFKLYSVYDTNEGVAFDDFEIYNDENLADETIITNTNEVNKNNDITVYPNPATNNLQISINNEQLAEDIQILDITGKLIVSLSLQGTKQIIDISNLQSGVYFIKIRSSVQKFIKE